MTARRKKRDLPFKERKQIAETQKQHQYVKVTLCFLLYVFARVYVIKKKVCELKCMQ